MRRFLSIPFIFIAVYISVYQSEKIKFVTKCKLIAGDYNYNQCKYIMYGGDYKSTPIEWETTLIWSIMVTVIMMCILYSKEVYDIYKNGYNRKY